MAIQAGLTEKDGVTTRSLEAHYLAGGNVPNVVRALIAANRADIPLSYKRAAAIDLAGRNVLEAVQTSVNPKVIDCPDPTQGRPTIDAVAKNGIQLKVKARVTVRTNIDRLVGGATEETIIARVGEGIVTTIGSAETHNQVLENPDSISKRVLEKGLDAGTAFEILSIDIADIDVGDNIGANLQAPRPRPTPASPAPRPRSVAPSPSPPSRRSSPPSRRTAPRSSPPRPRSRWRSPRPSARATSASPTTTTCGTSRPTPRCGPRSPARAPPDASRRTADGPGVPARGVPHPRGPPPGSPRGRATTAMRFENIFQFIVPLTFFAIWALTSLFNREAQPLAPARGASPRSEWAEADALRSPEALRPVEPGADRPQRDPTMRWSKPSAPDRPPARRPAPPEELDNDVLRIPAEPARCAPSSEGRRKPRTPSCRAIAPRPFAPPKRPEPTQASALSRSMEHDVALPVNRRLVSTPCPSRSPPRRRPTWA